MKSFLIEIDQQLFSVVAEVSDDLVWIHCEGETFTMPIHPSQEGRRWRAKTTAVDPGTLVAPMPGKITKIFVQQGDEVRAGQSVLVMEAMKMEYTLKAGALGQVTELRCQLDQQVTLGQTLVKLRIKEDEHKGHDR